MPAVVCAPQFLMLAHRLKSWIALLNRLAGRVWQAVGMAHGRAYLFPMTFRQRIIFVQCYLTIHSNLDMIVFVIA